MRPRVSALMALALSACSGGSCHTSVSKSWDASYSVSYGGGGGGSSVDAGVAPVASAGPASVDAAAASEAGAATALRGVFHQDSRPDEKNLSIDDDGSFHLRIHGCDYSSDTCGRWTVSGTSLVLTPSSGKTMDWEDGVSFTRPVTKVVLREKGGFLEARVSAADGETYLQVWKPGRVCAKCGSGTVEGCTGPLPGRCP